MGVQGAKIPEALAILHIKNVTLLRRFYMISCVIKFDINGQVQVTTRAPRSRANLKLFKIWTLALRKRCTFHFRKGSLPQ